jgi:hypothetical protein
VLLSQRGDQHGGKQGGRGGTVIVVAASGGSGSRRAVRQRRRRVALAATRYPPCGGSDRSAASVGLRIACWSSTLGNHCAYAVVPVLDLARSSTYPYGTVPVRAFGYTSVQCTYSVRPVVYKVYSVQCTSTTVQYTTISMTEIASYGCRSRLVIAS